MKHFSQYFVLGLAVLAASGTIYAGPSGPSAKSAARLKKYPTSRWLAHYLPDDRYKIAGGVWKYVSTDLDTYYHLPNSSYMMRQPADRVIGFSSAEEALEAGYKPDPSLGGLSSQGGVMALAGSAPGAGSSVAARAARRVILADGASSVILPAGWRALRGGGQRAQNVAVTVDQLIGPKGQRLTFMTVVFSGPQMANIDMGKFVNANFMRNVQNNMGRFSSAIERSGAVNSQFSAASMMQMSQFQNMKFFPVSLGGVAGVGAVNPRPAIGMPRRTYTFGRGSKMWTMSDLSSGRQNALNVIKTFKLR